MGGPGSGGYKNAPGDVETHAAWTILPLEPDSTQKIAQVRCKYCSREMAQHTSRQRAHLLSCETYLDEMRSQGIENTITKQAADPAGFFKNSKSLAIGTKSPKAAKGLAMSDHTMAVRIQALALAEASIAAERIFEITGIDPRVQTALRNLARERGYNPAVSMQVKEEYVSDPPDTPRPRGRPKKRKPEDELDPALAEMQPGRAPPGYVQADSLQNNLPPGQWDFSLQPAVQHQF